MKLATNVTEVSMTHMHPALDFVGDVAYVAVNVVDEQQGLITAIVSSKGEVWNKEEWDAKAKELGFIPRIRAVELTNTRWKQISVQALLDGKLEAPTWEEAYNAIYTYLDDRLVMQDQRYIAVLTLYAMMTYFHPLFKVLPLLHLLGQSGSGKSIAAILLAQIAFNGSVEGSITASSLFRSAHEGRYTQVLTETDELAELGSGDALVRYLQAGTTKAEATITLTETKNNRALRPESFYIFNPRVLVSTKQFKAPTLRNRCIRLDITRTKDADQKKLRRPRDEKQEAELRDMMYCLLLLKRHEIADAQEWLLDTWNVTTGRVFDKFLPLASMAFLVSTDVLGTVNELATEGIAEAKRDEGTTFEALLYRFARYLVKDGDERLTEQEMYTTLLDSSNTAGIEPWLLERCVPDWASEQGQTYSVAYLSKCFRTRQSLAFELKRLNLIPKEKDKQRKNSGQPYSISKGHVDALVALHIDEEEQAA